MAIQYKFKNTHTFNSSSSRLYLEDDTGLYSSSNTGGYGTPNLARNTLALIPVGIYKSSTGNRLITFDKYNPLTATVFNAVIGIDGWYEFHLLSFPIYDATQLQSYAAGDSYYDSVSGNILNIQVDSITTLNVAVVVSSDYLLGTSYEVAKSDDELVAASNTKIMIRINANISNYITNNIDFLEKKLVRYKNNYDAVRIILQGSLYEFARGNKAVAQKNLEFLNTNDYLKV